MKLHPCIGGPLSGTHAQWSDFFEDGVHQTYRGEYHQFNTAYHRALPAGAANVIFVHTSLLT